MRFILAAFLALVANASDNIVFDQPLLATTTVEEGDSIVMAVTASLADPNVAHAPFEAFIMQIHGDTAYKVTSTTNVTYINFKGGELSFTHTFIDNESSWTLTVTIAGATVDNLDMNEVEIEFHLLDDSIQTATTVYVWREGTVTISGLDLHGDETLSVNSTDIATCSVDGAHPAPEAVTMAIGGEDFPNLALNDTVAVLSAVPAYFSRGSAYDQQSISCRFEQTVDGQTVNSVLKNRDELDTELIYSFTYATTTANIELIDNGADLENFDGKKWVAKGQAVNVKCSADGNPRPEVTIKQGGSAVATGTDEEGPMTSVSALSAAMNADSNTVSCSAGGQTVSAVVHAHSSGDQAAFMNGTSVYAAERLVVTEGDEIAITCKAGGLWHPIATTKIEKDNRSQVDGLTGVATADMAGNYTCSAHNHFTQGGKVKLEVFVDPQSGSAGSSQTIVIIVIIVVVLLLIAGVGVFVYKKKQEKGNDGTPNNDEENPEATALSAPPPSDETRPRSSTSSDEHN